MDTVDKLCSTLLPQEVFKRAIGERGRSRYCRGVSDGKLTRVVDKNVDNFRVVDRLWIT
mgnify:CR=1 FL=1